MIEPGDTTGKIFYFDGMTAAEVTSLPAGMTLFKSTSVYYESTSGFWAVPYDASSYMVGNGRQANDDDNDESEEDASGEEDTEEENPLGYFDWHQIQFNWDEQRYSSLVWIVGEHAQVQIQRPDQLWLPQILPEQYHTQQVTPHPAYGALNGDLSILLALVAFSVRPSRVQDAVQHCLLGTGWRAHNLARGCKSVGCVSLNSC